VPKASDDFGVRVEGVLGDLDRMEPIDVSDRTAGDLGELAQSRDFGNAGG